MDFGSLRARPAYGIYGKASFLGDTVKPPIDLLLKLRMTRKGKEVLSDWEFNILSRERIGPPKTSLTFRIALGTKPL